MEEIARAASASGMTSLRYMPLEIPDRVADPRELGGLTLDKLSCNLGLFLEAAQLNKTIDYVDTDYLRGLQFSLRRRHCHSH